MTQPVVWHGPCTTVGRLRPVNQTPVDHGLAPRPRATAQRDLETVNATIGLCVEALTCCSPVYRVQHRQASVLPAGLVFD